MKAVPFEQLSSQLQDAALERIEHYNVTTELSLYGDSTDKYLIWRTDSGIKYIHLLSGKGARPSEGAVVDTGFFRVSYRPEQLIGKSMMPYIGLPA